VLLKSMMRRPSLESVLVLATSPDPDAPDAETDAESDAESGADGAEPSLAIRAGGSVWVERVHNLYDPDSLPEGVAASRRAADAARRVVAGLVASDADAATLDAAAVALDAIAATLTHDTTPGSRSRYHETGGLRGGVDAESQVWESHPFLGPSHPFAPPLKVVREGDHSVALVTYTHVYEGPPGAVHGGIVAAGFDMVLGAAASMAKRPGLTGTLSVRYRKSMPLHREIRYEGWIDSVEARKTLVAGHATADGELVAEGHGIFVAIPERRLDPPVFDA
jgi:acyl-coenzyme A thioesterase PaaI-like protein